MKAQAAQLGIGTTTVKTHRENLVRKLGVKGITEAAALCAQWLPNTRADA
jgi:DNA-binding CsgD family transcriptional regulator